MTASGDASERASAAIREEAIDWFLLCREESLDRGGREDFLAWLRKSPQHVEAYVRTMALWEDTETLHKHARDSMEALVQQARVEETVAALSLHRTVPARSAPSRPRRFWRLACVATAASIAVVAALILPDRAHTIETAVGEQRVLTLEDGSRVELNSKSRIRVRYDGVSRAVDLLEGQALFSVAKDTRRPFLVFSQGTVVRAIGTQFDVNRTHGNTVVTVVEGRVAVSDLGDSRRSIATIAAATPPAPVVVSSGQRVVAAPHGVTPPETVNPANATAWIEGKLIFDSVPLNEVVAEFNRYLPRPLVVADSQLQAQRISGVFSISDSQLFVEFLHQRFGTRTLEDGRSTRIVAP